MCQTLCRRIINPSQRLEKMITFLRFLVLFSILIPILRLFFNDSSNTINDLICILILMGTTESLHFLLSGFYIMFVILNNIFSFFLIGSIIQAIIQGSALSNKNVEFLCVNIFIFLFYIFAIVLVFPAYKEMKAIFIEAANSQIPQSDVERNGIQRNLVPEAVNNNQNENNNNNNFRAFSGRGVQVG